MRFKLFLLLLFVLGYASSFEQFDCFKVVNCTCETDNFTKIKFICFFDYGNVSVEVEHKSALTINCEELINRQSVDFYESLPQFDESYFANGISLTVTYCDLPYKFSSISAKYPLIRKALFYLVQLNNVSQDFFDTDSPLTDFTFEKEVIYSKVNILLNLKNLENVQLSLETELLIPLPSKLFEGNMKLRSCSMIMFGFGTTIPVQLFHLNDALEQVIINFLPESLTQGFVLNIDDRLFSNKIHLVTVKLNSNTLVAAPPIPDLIFRNSTNLETIWLNRMGLTNLSG